MRNDEPERHEHEGSFAEGIEEIEHHPEREKGDFAEAEEESEHRHEGTFAEGIEETEHHPERHTKGDFAEGLDSED